MCAPGRWQPEEVAKIAAKWRTIAGRHSRVTIPTADIFVLCDKIIEVMREANELADELDRLKVENAKPKFAPFAPSRRAVR